MVMVMVVLVVLVVLVWWVCQLMCLSLTILIANLLDVVICSRAVPHKF